MKYHGWQALVLLSAVALGGCSFVSDSLWPSLTGDEPAGGEQIPIAPSAAEASPTPTLGSAPTPPPTLGTTQFVPAPVTHFQPTGTFVGQKVNTLRGELGSL